MFQIEISVSELMASPLQNSLIPLFSWHFDEDRLPSKIRWSHIIYQNFHLGKIELCMAIILFTGDDQGDVVGLKPFVS